MSALTYILNHLKIRNIVFGVNSDGVTQAPVPLNADGTAVVVSGTLTATIDESTLATSAKQDTGNTSLASIDTKSPAKGTAVMTGSIPVTLATNDTIGLTLATSAKQDTGNTSLASIVTNTGNIPAKGTAVMTGAMPVTLATNDTLGLTLATAAAQATAQTSLTTIAAFGAAGTPIRTLNGVVAGSVDPGHNISVVSGSATAAASQATTNGYAWFSAPAANTVPIYLGKSSAVTTGLGIEFYPGDKLLLACANTSEWFAITGTSTQACHVVAE